MSDIGSQIDRDVLSAVVNGVAAGIPLEHLIANATVSNSIVRQLDALGLDGNWFSFGPYRGWRIGPELAHWTVLEWDDSGYNLASTATGFVDALALMIEGKQAKVLALFIEASKRKASP